MSSRVQSASVKTIDYADWVITLVLLGVMIAALALTAPWPAGTAFFPRLLSGASIVLILFKISSMLWDVFSAAPAPAISAAQNVAAPAGKSEGGEITLVTDVDEDQGNEDEFHKIFSHADGRMWAEAVGWLVLFFAGMYLFGLLVTLPVFTVLYLRLVAKASWLVCLLYVLATAGLIYLLFVLVLHLPLPQGIFPIIGE